MSRLLVTLGDTLRDGAGILFPVPLTQLVKVDKQQEALG